MQLGAGDVDRMSRTSSAMPFLDEGVASAYARWHEGPSGAVAQRLQHQLLLQLLDPKWGETVLDVGCGTGETLQRLADAGLRVTGVDRSPAMLARARRRLGRVPLLLGDAAALPFADASFDLVILNTTLEFLERPEAAVAELVRVARGRIYVGVLNRWSALAARLRWTAWWRGGLYRHARFCPLHEVLGLLAAGGTARRRWGGVAYVPEVLCGRAAARRLASGMAGWPNPFAGYLGFAADVERLELVRQPSRPPIEVVPAPEAAIARVGIRRAVARVRTYPSVPCSSESATVK